jgi:hypothetical protein
MVLGQVVAGLSQLSVQLTLGRSWIDGGISDHLVQLGAGTGEEPDDQSCGSRSKIVYSLSEGTGRRGAVHWACWNGDDDIFHNLFERHKDAKLSLASKAGYVIVPFRYIYVPCGYDYLRSMRILWSTLGADGDQSLLVA